MKYLAIIASAQLIGACISARVDVFDQKTALENQVLGSFDELSQDMHLAASVGDSTTEQSAGAGLVDPELTRSAIIAVQEREENRKSIDELKGLGLIGENKEGLLSLLLERNPDAGARQVELARRMVEEENGDRKTLSTWVVEYGQDLTRSDLPDVLRVLQLTILEDARPGDPIQREDGAWAEHE